MQGQQNIKKKYICFSLCVAYTLYKGDLNIYVCVCMYIYIL